MTYIGLVIVAFLNIYGQSFAASIQNHGSESSERIVGGTLAKNHDKPYLALIMYNVPYKGDFLPMICGGNVITKSWVLTAAHCIEDDGEDYTLHMGMNTWCNGSSKNIYFSDGHVQRKVAQSIKYPGYVSHAANDIGLMKMDRPIGLGGNIQIARLPKTPPPAGNELTVAGWGDIVEGSSYRQCDLKEVTVRVFTDAECAPYLRGDTTHFCAGYMEGKRDSCRGDSGGGLMSKEADGKFYLHGIVSYGFGCARSNSPGYYTRVLNYVHWINSIIKNHSL